MFPKRTDVNQTEIVRFFRKLGVTVQILSMVGKGCPDLLIACNSYNILIEIKDGKKSTSKQKLTKDEKSFFEMWKGEVYIINSIEQAHKLLNEVRKRNAIKRLL